MIRKKRISHWYMPANIIARTAKNKLSFIFIMVFFLSADNLKKIGEKSKQIHGDIRLNSEDWKLAYIWVNPYVPNNGAQWLYFLCVAWSAKNIFVVLSSKTKKLSCGKCFMLRKVPKTKTNWNADMTKDKIYLTYFDVDTRFRYCKDLK